jgi:crossover junction endodeoxyribonuclease RuvC
MQQMVKLLLGLAEVPAPHDAADALAVAICHLHSTTGAVAQRAREEKPRTALRSWRDYRP